MWFLALILGLIVGSFLNVVIFRLNTGRTLGGRSMCFSCGKTLSWYELVPLVSYVFQRGRCLGCKSRISPQYFLVELLTGVIFLALYLKFYIDSEFFIYCIISALLIVIGVYDYHHKIIPDKVVYPLIIVSLLTNIYIFPFSFYSINFLIGPIFFSFFGLIWLISKGTWMGFGDAKLSLAVGWFLGATAGVLAMLVAFWVGAIVGILMLALKRSSITINHEIPFAPFIVFGAFVGLLFDLNIFEYLVLRL